MNYLVHVPSTDMEEAGCNPYSSASHLGAIKMLWFHFWGAVFHIYTVCAPQLPYKCLEEDMRQWSFVFVINCFLL